MFRRFAAAALASVAVLVSATTAGAQQAEAIRAAVIGFYRAVENHDISAMRKLIVSDAIITSVGVGVGKPVVVSSRSIGVMIDAVGIAPQTWLQRFGHTEIKVDGIAAEFTGTYKFLINGEQEYCGRTAILLVKNADKWLIAAITESQVESACPSP